MFGASLLGLLIACVAEHLIRHKSYYKGTLKERIGLWLVRGVMLVLTLLVFFETPRFTNDTTCKPDPEAQYPAAECN